ncbi:DUF6372 family protein [Streptomyces sp. NPDC018059]|uniref:DUF6372 family protein n=1 Tax=Streptomyces sp. NPDC018059 TaxID=3365041 RepID=UPI0037919C4F
MADELMPDRPVLYLTKTWMITWEQRRPGGCRCLCRLYHQGGSTCTAAADPGHPLRVVSPETTHLGSAEISEALVLCAPCYAAITPLAGPPRAG